MRKSTALIFCCALIFVSGDSQSNTNKETKPIVPVVLSTTVTPNPTTSPNPPTTTPEPTTTESTTTSTTPKSTTTTTTTPTSTTPSPVTTTNAPITTTPIPTPDPTKGLWIVNNTDSMIIAQMAVQLVIHYEGENKQNLTKPINIPSNKNITKAAGTFNVKTETLILSWQAGSGSDSVTFSFESDNKTYALTGVIVSIEPEDLPNSSLKAPLKLIHKAQSFNTSIGNSYRCVRLQTFNLTKENDANVIGQMKITDLQFQAFAKAKDNKGIFGFAEDCAFDTPDAVPIAVGCILAGLVVIVLVAYLISRRRSQAPGYHSM